MEKVKTFHMYVFTIKVPVPDQYFDKYSKDYGSLHTKFIDGINEFLYGQQRTVPYVNLQ
jgi:hypothetical protein